MNNLKKFFAFSIATAMVAGAVWGITPALKLLAYNENSKFNYDEVSGKYVEAVDGKYPYVDVKKSGKEIAGEYKAGSGNSGSVNTGGGSGDIESSNVNSVVLDTHINYLHQSFSLKFTAHVTYTDNQIDTNNIRWYTTTPETIKIDPETGLVTALKVGEAKIIAESIKDPTKKDDLTFIIIPKNEILNFKDIDPEKGLVISVGETKDLQIEGAEKYSSDEYRYYWWDVRAFDSDEKIATMTEGKITGKAVGKGRVHITIAKDFEFEDSVEVASVYCNLEVVAESSSPTNADPRGITPHDDVVVTPAVVANYQKWLSTFGGGTAEGTQAVSGTAGQPGSEVVVADPKTGQTLHMFQSTDNSNTLMAAPESIVPSGTKITTLEAAADTPAFKAVQNKIARVSRRGSVQKVYGIAATATDGTLITTLNGKAAMSVPIPADINVPAGKTLVVYFIPNEGEITKLETVIDQGRVVFGTPGFGTFAFVVE